MQRLNLLFYNASPMAFLLLIQLPSTAHLEGVQVMVQVLQSLPPTGEAQRIPKPLALAWLSPSSYGHLGSKFVGVTFSLSLCFSNKDIQTLTKIIFY